MFIFGFGYRTPFSQQQHRAAVCERVRMARKDSASFERARNTFAINQIGSAETKPNCKNAESRRQKRSSVLLVCSELDCGISFCSFSVTCTWTERRMPAASLCKRQHGRPVVNEMVQSVLLRLGARIISLCPLLRLPALPLRLRFASPLRSAPEASRSN